MIIKIQGDLLNIKISEKVEIETIDNEILIYNPDNDNILILNSTASYIFEILQEQMLNAVENLSYELLYNKMKQVFEFDKFDCINFSKDIDEIIGGLVKEGVLICI